MNSLDRIPRRCEICGVPGDRPDARLVRDHCHDTGLFRGILCEACNSRIGALETNGTGTKPSFAQWLEVYFREIDKYLDRGTRDFLYEGRRSKAVLRILRSRGHTQKTKAVGV